MTSPAIWLALEVLNRVIAINCNLFKCLWVCVKPSKSVPHTSFSLYLTGFDIGSIETRHKTSFEPSNSLGDDDLASRFILLVVHIYPLVGGVNETVCWCE